MRYRNNPVWHSSPRFLALDGDQLQFIGTNLKSKNTFEQSSVYILLNQKIASEKNFEVTYREIILYCKKIRFNRNYRRTVVAGRTYFTGTLKTFGFCRFFKTPKTENPSKWPPNGTSSDSVRDRHLPRSGAGRFFNVTFCVQR